MSEARTSFVQALVVEEELHLTLVELCRACGAPEDQVTELVLEGVLEPVGQDPELWRFTGPSLGRARLALRLTRDFELDPAGVALALELLDEIMSLRARLARSGML